MKKKLCISLNNKTASLLEKEAIKENLAKSQLIERILNEHYNTDRNKLNKDIRENFS